MYGTTTPDAVSRGSLSRSSFPPFIVLIVCSDFDVTLSQLPVVKQSRLSPFGVDGTAEWYHISLSYQLFQARYLTAGWCNNYNCICSPRTWYSIQIHLTSTADVSQRTERFSAAAGSQKQNLPTIREYLNQGSNSPRIKATKNNTRVYTLITTVHTRIHRKGYPIGGN